MDDKLIREQIHRAVDAYGASMQDDPFLARRILASTDRKEAPRMKKLSTGMIIAIVLMLLSVTAVAVGLTVEQIWQQSFEKMGTSGEIWNIGEPTSEDLTMDEAAAIARQAIKDKFAVTDEELDAMGFYPSYFEAEVDDGIAYPSSWRFLWSSRTNVDIAKDDDDHGPNGEYRVYMNGVTGEIDTCIFYTTDFWRYAQRIWDVGNYDEVYRRYKQTDFFNQPTDVQEYWTKLLAEKGYAVRTANESLHQALRSAHLELLFNPVNTFADNDDPQVAAAWKALEREYGLNAELLRKYAYVATVPGWNTGYDDVCIHYSYETEWHRMETGFLDQWNDRLFTFANHLGLYMVSFEKGTTNVAAITHVLRSETTGINNIPEYGLLTRTDWSVSDFLAFDEAYNKLDRAVKRMHAVNMDNKDIEIVVLDYMRGLGANPAWFPAADAAVNTEVWFDPESELDATIPEPAMSYEEFTAKYGHDQRFWPQEALIAYQPIHYRMPNEGEMTFDEALKLALAQLAKEQNVTDLTGWTINVQRVSLTADPNEVNCRWQVYITDDPTNPINGWKIQFGEWEDTVDVPTIQDITDMSNG